QYNVGISATVRHQPFSWLQTTIAATRMTYAQVSKPGWPCGMITQCSIPVAAEPASTAEPAVQEESIAPATAYATKPKAIVPRLTAVTLAHGRIRPTMSTITP